MATPNKHLGQSPPGISGASLAPHSGQWDCSDIGPLLKPPATIDRTGLPPDDFHKESADFQGGVKV
jgi:hypothetical protein